MKVVYTLLGLLAAVAPVSSEEGIGGLGEFCNICGFGQEVKNVDGIVVIENAGNRTCQELMDLGATGGFDADQCAEILVYSAAPCECGVFQCNVCGEGKVISNSAGRFALPDGGDFQTCAVVFETAQAGGFDETECPLIQDAAQMPCGCEISVASPTPMPNNFSAPLPTSSPVDGFGADGDGSSAAAGKLPMGLSLMAALILASCTQW